MQPRVLRFKLPEKLIELKESRGINFTASSIGISRGSLEKILNDKWDSVSRSVIERICDRFDLKIEEIFELAPSRFWATFAKNRRYAFVATTIARQESSKSKRVNLFDQRAMVEVRRYLEKSFKIRAYDIFDDVENEERLIQLAMSQDTIVIGSPRSNPAAEILLCRLFGIKPFRAAPEPPLFSFIWTADHQQKRVSAFSLPIAEGGGSELKPGIALHGKSSIVEVDWLPSGQYFSETLKNRRDCGFVMIVNKPFNTQKDVKLILMGGYSGLGTLAAAKALIRDFRNLEPRDDSERAIGLFEVRYNKMHESTDDRELRRYFWKYLIGGRLRKVPGKP